METVEYESKAAGAKRKMLVYTPPGFSKDQKYPVLYLLHGGGDDETGWTKKGAADVILDNLYADKKAVPMIVVMPNGRVVKAGREAGQPVRRVRRLREGPARRRDPVRGEDTTR